MCVPAHDQRDFDFAKKFGLDIVEVIRPEGQEEKELTEAYAGDGVIVNSPLFDGMTAFEAKQKAPHMLEEMGIGKKTVNYKLRDWVFARQRYWGEPIPIVHCEKCGYVPIDESELPLVLPQVDSYEPTDNGESPLSKMTDWVNTTCPKCGGKIIEKKSKRGRVFYGCDNYPKCDFVSWDAPSDKICPVCGKVLLKKKDKAQTLYCVTPGCTYTFNKDDVGEKDGE